MNGDLQVETTTAVEFLHEFFVDTKYSIEFRALPSKRRVFTRKPDEIAGFLSANGDENLYFGVCTREGGGKAEHCRELSALFADVDSNDDGTFKRIESFPLEPSVVNFSGGGYHIFWLLNQPIDPRDPHVVPFLKGISLALEADPTCAEIARVLRVPGTFNYKKKYSQPCAVYTVRENWNRRYSLDDFKTFGAVPNRKAGKRAGAPVIAKELSEGQRHRVLLSMAGTMRRRGAEEEEIYAALTTMNRLRGRPPLEDEEVRAIAEDVSSRYQPQMKVAAIRGRVVGSPVDQSAPGRTPITETSNAERLYAKRRNDLRYCSDRDVWCVWNGDCWAVNDTGAVMRHMQEITRDVYFEAANEKDEYLRKALAQWARQSDSRRTQENSVSLARYFKGIEIRNFSESFDRQPLLLNVRNGTIDLRTGQLLPHRREDFLTKMVPLDYDPTAICPKFSRFLNETFALEQEELVGYVERCMGYFLSGLTSQQCWWLFYGGTSTGKSTLVSILHGLLGPYALALPENYFLITKSSSDFATAMLAGVRLATCVETNEGRRLDVAKVKMLTGGDTVSAAFKYENLFSFKMQAKLILATNYPPQAPAGDNALWRRVRVVPFKRNPVASDARILDLAAQLVEDEGSGILRLAVHSSPIQSHRGGLDEPDVVKSAINEYRDAEDLTQSFLADFCVNDGDSRVARKELYAAYVDWSKQNGLYSMKAKKFAMELRRLGITGDLGERYWLGVRIKKDTSI